MLLCEWCRGYLSRVLVPLPAHVFAGSVCLLHGYLPFWEFSWLNHSSASDSAEFLDQGARTRGFLPLFCIQTIWKVDVYPSDPLHKQGSWDVMRLPSGHISTHLHFLNPSPCWQVGIPLVLGVKNAFVEKSGRICEWPIGLPRKVQRRVTA